MSVRIEADGNGSRMTWAEVVQVFAESPQWQIDGTKSASVQAQRAASGRNPSLWFQIPGVNGKLELTYFGADDVICEIVFLSSLDVGLREMRGQFAQNLANAHKSIAEKYVTEYLQSHVSTGTILTGRIPASADMLSIQATVAAITAIAIEIHQLHGKITAPLTELD